MHHRHLKDFIITKKTHEDKKRPAAEDKDPYNDYRKAQFFPSVRTYLVWLIKKYLINTAVFFFFLLLLGRITFVNPFTDECQIIFSFHSSTVHTWRQKVSSCKFQSPKVKNQRERKSPIEMKIYIIHCPCWMSKTRVPCLVICWPLYISWVLNQ